MSISLLMASLQAFAANPTFEDANEELDKTIQARTQSAEHIQHAISDGMTTAG